MLPAHDAHSQLPPLPQQQQHGPPGAAAAALRAWLAASPSVAAGPAAAAPHLRPKLLALPELYQNLYLEWSERPCARCRRPPREPALCLVCGALVCCAGECCAARHPHPHAHAAAALGDAAFRFGHAVEPGSGLLVPHTAPRECFTHAASCGAGTCVFLLVKATKLLLLRGPRSCVFPSPYLDSHGEEDMYLRRGRPLYLSEERYTAVGATWRAAAFDADTHALHASRTDAQHY